MPWWLARVPAGEVARGRPVLAQRLRRHLVKPTPIWKLWTRVLEGRLDRLAEGMLLAQADELALDIVV